MKAPLALLVATGLALTACQQQAATPARGSDPDQLSADLETRAQEIERRADAAVVRIERESAAEIAELRMQSPPGPDAAPANQ